MYNHSTCEHLCHPGAVQLLLDSQRTSIPSPLLGTSHKVKDFAPVHGSLSPNPPSGGGSRAEADIFIQWFSSPSLSKAAHVVQHKYMVQRRCCEPRCLLASVSQKFLLRFLDKVAPNALPLPLESAESFSRSPESVPKVPKPHLSLLHKTFKIIIHG